MAKLICIPELKTVTLNIGKTYLKKTNYIWQDWTDKFRKWNCTAISAKTKILNLKAVAQNKKTLNEEVLI